MTRALVIREDSDNEERQGDWWSKTLIATKSPVLEAASGVTREIGVHLLGWVTYLIFFLFYIWYIFFALSVITFHFLFEVNITKACRVAQFCLSDARALASDQSCVHCALRCCAPPIVIKRLSGTRNESSRFLFWPYHIPVPYIYLRLRRIHFINLNNIRSKYTKNWKTRSPTRPHLQLNYDIEL